MYFMTLSSNAVNDSSNFTGKIIMPVNHRQYSTGKIIMPVITGKIITLVIEPPSLAKYTTHVKAFHVRTGGSAKLMGCNGST